MEYIYTYQNKNTLIRYITVLNCKKKLPVQKLTIWALQSLTIIMHTDRLNLPIVPSTSQETM